MVEVTWAWCVVETPAGAWGTVALATPKPSRPGKHPGSSLAWGRVSFSLPFQTVPAANAGAEGRVPTPTPTAGRHGEKTRTQDLGRGTRTGVLGWLAPAAALATRTEGTGGALERQAALRRPVWRGRAVVPGAVGWGGHTWPQEGPGGTEDSRSLLDQLPLGLPLARGDKPSPSPVQAGGPGWFLSLLRPTHPPPSAPSAGPDGFETEPRELSPPPKPPPGSKPPPSHPHSSVRSSPLWSWARLLPRSPFKVNRAGAAQASFPPSPQQP